MKVHSPRGQAILDFDAGSLIAHDNVMEWMPRITGYETSEGIFSATTGNLILNLTNGTATTIALPQGADPFSVVWWHSLSLGSVFLVYYATGDMWLSACRYNGDCMTAPAPPTIGFGTLRPGPALVWDHEGLVGLPVECCFCIDFEYHTFSLDRNSGPALTSVRALNTLGSVWYDTDQKQVWGSGSESTGYRDHLSVERYNYEQHAATYVKLSTSQLESMFNNDMSSWKIVLIAVGSTVLLLGFFGGVLCLLKRRSALGQGHKRTTSETQVTDAT